VQASCPPSGAKPSGRISCSPQLWSAAYDMIEYMFESQTSPSTPAILVERICATSRAENRTVGQRLAAIGELDLLRLRQVGERETWCTDTQEAVAAEVAAALQIAQGLAMSYRYYSRAMRHGSPEWERCCRPAISTIGCCRPSSTAPT
jgi:hypothetical protein